MYLLNQSGTAIYNFDKLSYYYNESTNNYVLYIGHNNSQFDDVVGHFSNEEQCIDVIQKIAIAMCNNINLYIIPSNFTDL